MLNCGGCNIQSHGMNGAFSLEETVLSNKYAFPLTLCLNSTLLLLSGDGVGSLSNQNAFHLTLCYLTFNHMV